MQIPESVFREYDIRGVVGSELTPEFARRLGRAVAAAAAERIGRLARLVVGRDNRPSGAALHAALSEGIVAVGGTAVDIGELPTPALYLAIHELGADGGVQVTGSHNPPEYNGFKITIAGRSMHGDDIARLRQRMAADDFAPMPGKMEHDASVLTRYREAIVERHRLARPVRVVVDCGNGVTSLVAIETLREIGATVIPLYAESDGTFPNHHPDPSEPENMIAVRDAVLANEAELGIAFDGDGDRVGAVNAAGQIVYGDRLLAAFARDAVARFGTGIKVVYDVKCSDALADSLHEAGAVPVMWRTGHSLIKEKMRSTGAPLAGEMSGHFFFGGDWPGFDDALFAAARLIEIVSHGRGGLDAVLPSFPSLHSTPEIRVPCADDRKFELVRKASAHFATLYPVATIDGVRISWPDGWGLCRASNTQPALVLRFEASTARGLKRNQDEVMTWLAAQGVGR